MIRLARLSAVVAASAMILSSAGGAFAQAPRQGGGQQQPDLPSLLHLRPDQMNAFHAFQTAGQPRPDELTPLRGASPQAMASLRTPERLQRIDAFLNAQLQVFHRNADATRAFYAQLSPDQQKTFDQITGPGQQGGPNR